MEKWLSIIAINFKGILIKLKLVALDSSILLTLYIKDFGKNLNFIIMVELLIKNFHFSKAFLPMENEKDLELRFMKIVIFILVSFEKIKRTILGYIFSKKEVFIMVSLKTIKEKALVN